MAGSVGICIYCGEENPLTREHIPPRNLFSSGEGVDYRFVLICEECNKSYSKDEEFFRNWLANAHYKSSDEATKLFDGPITRAYKRKPALAEYFFKNMSLVEVYDPTTKKTEAKTALKNNPEDKARVIRVVEKIVRGLASWHFGERINSDMKVEARQIGDAWLEKQKDEVQKMPLLTVKEDVFEYRYGQIPDTQFSMWLMRFYDGTTFVGFIADEAFFNRKRK